MSEGATSISSMDKSVAPDQQDTGGNIVSKIASLVSMPMDTSAEPCTKTGTSTSENATVAVVNPMISRPPRLPQEISIDTVLQTPLSSHGTQEVDTAAQVLTPHSTNKNDDTSDKGPVTEPVVDESTENLVSATGDNVINNTTSLNAVSIRNCTVSVERLSSIDCEMWLNPSTTIGGYCMRSRKIKALRLARQAKLQVMYQWSSDEASEDSVQSNNSAVHKKPVKYLPSQGPSKAWIVAQKYKTTAEREAAEALIALRNSGDECKCENTQSSDVSGNSDDDTGDNAHSKSDDDAGDNAHGVQSADTEILSSDDGKEKRKSDNEAITDMDDVPLSIVQRNLHETVNAGASTSGMKQKPKAEFVEKHHSLRKYKRKRNFPCKDCDFKSSSQGELNDHYAKKHGNLTCDTCGKLCHTLSSLQKHKYDHTDKANKYPCSDCEKAFPFSSQLKTTAKYTLRDLNTTAFTVLRASRIGKNL